MGIKIAAIMASIMLVMTGAFYWYYQDSQARIQTLSENNAKLETAVATNEQTIDSLQESYAQSQEQLRAVHAEFRQIRRQNNVLAEKLERHDLGVLGNARPGLVENVVNRATDKVNRCFEIISGAELTEEERNAESGEAFNSECPWLFDPNNSR